MVVPGSMRSHGDECSQESEKTMLRSTVKCSSQRSPETFSVTEIACIEVRIHGFCPVTGNLALCKNEKQSSFTGCHSSKFQVHFGFWPGLKERRKECPWCQSPCLSSALLHMLAMFSELPALLGPCLCDSEPLERKMSLGPRIFRRFTLMGPS